MNQKYKQWTKEHECLAHEVKLKSGEKQGEEKKPEKHYKNNM